jgi:hypothetical protein
VSGRMVHSRLTVGLSLVLVAVGVTAIVRTALAGGGGLSLGYLMGAGLLVAGTLRLWLAWKMTRRG